LVTNSHNQLILLLPERRRFSGQPMSPAIAKLLARADRQAESKSGEREQLLRYFELQPPTWPMAALSREADGGDAGQAVWLRADPVFVRPDINGARLMAWGNLGVTPDEAEAFLEQLRPTFSELGLQLSALAGERWYVRVAADESLPDFATPVEGLGEDLLAHLPVGPDALAWRKLLNEAQIILHNHPRNASRLAAGLLPVNSLWFWGGGALPEAVSCKATSVVSEDHELLALAGSAGVSFTQLASGSCLLDLRSGRDWPSLERARLLPALTQRATRYQSVLLDFADGASFLFKPSHRLRWWRRSLDRLTA
jgi:hypothetical protein